MNDLEKFRIDLLNLFVENVIRDVGAVALVDAFKTNTALIELDVDCTSLPPFLRYLLRPLGFILCLTLRIDLMSSL